MKFLEVDSLDLINTDFRWETSECILTGRVEAYSCKEPPNPILYMIRYNGN